MNSDVEKLLQLQTLVEQVSPDAAARRVVQLDEEIDALQSEIDSRRKQQSVLRRTFGLTRQDLKARGETKPVDTPGRAVPRVVDQAFHPNVGPLRLGILDYVKSFDGKPVKLAQIMRAMVEKGLVPDDENGQKRVSVTTIRLAKKGDLERAPAKGYYQLPTHGDSHEAHGDDRGTGDTRELAPTAASSVER
ncbi:MAG: hypothetical protein ACPGWS_06000 [Solirubrobacterales bacterium]